MLYVMMSRQLCDIMWTDGNSSIRDVYLVYVEECIDMDGGRWINSLPDCGK